MTNLLRKLFIKDYNNLQDKKIRQKHGNLASIFGIVSNIIICSIKIVVGLIFNLISLVADGFNNLADGASSIVSLIGFKLSGKPADKDHPYGHARIEYISGFIVSLIVFILGLQLILDSVNDIIDNWGKQFTTMSDTYFIISIIVLFFSIIAKLLQGRVYKKIGNLISSQTLLAASTDSRNDVIATSGVLVGLIISKIFNFYTDGYLGLLIGLFILYSGINLIKESSNPLIGEKIDTDLLKQYIEKIKSYDGILGVHDVQIHAYGPNTYFATLHVEVDANSDILSTHDLIDNIEKEVQEQFNIITTIHMDPVVLNDPYTEEVKNNILPKLKELTYIKNIHDFRVVKGPTHTNIVFDVIVEIDNKMKDEEIKKEIVNLISSIDSTYRGVITVDRDYIAFH